MLRHLLLALALLAPVPVYAGEAMVQAASAEATGATWRISVTLRHDDTGWDHYADGWAVETEDGIRLGYRTLLHPHVTEQPFTRSLSDVAVPAGTDRIFIRAHDNVHGPTADRFELVLP